MKETTKSQRVIVLCLSLILGGCAQTAINKPSTIHVNNVSTSSPVESEPKPVPEKITVDTAALTAESTVVQKEKKIAVEPKPEQPDNLWSRLFSRYQLSHIDHKRIGRERDWFLKHPDYLKRVQKRAAPYLYYIVTQAEQRNIPAEITLLPIVESAFQPFAYSHGRAAGIWQFIPSTGRFYGLKQNWWYDGRRDIYASTQSALNYLNSLNKTFDGDWMLALAAYNSGAGTVRKAIRKNKARHKPTNYWALNLPKETRSYVPRLLAIADIFANAEKYGIELIDIPNQPQFAVIDTGSQLDLALAAEMADLPIEELYKLNPGFNRWSTDPDGPHRLLIPIEKSEQFKEKLTALPTDKRVKWIRHRIRSGETLSHIARRHNTSITVVRQINKIRGHTIRAGKYLLVPTSTQKLAHYSLSAVQRKQATQQVNRSGRKTIYTVQRGDTLWDIARSHSVSTRRLASWNSMAPRDLLRPGQKLAIWTKSNSNNKLSSKTSPIDPFRSVNYTVRSGDSLYLIARRFNVSIPELRKWNNKQLGKYLKPGQRLRVNVDITRPTI